MRFSYTYNNTQAKENLFFSLEKAIEKSTRVDFLYVKDNHLGNVMVVVSDKKIGVDNNTDGTTDYYLADVISATDYYSGHMIMPGRSYNSNAYRYGGSNGQEKDDEITGVTGSHYSAEYWEYDSRLGRRWNTDPMTAKYPHMSPYAAFENNPIYFKDPTGGDAEVTIIGNTIYVTAKIKIYGSGATSAKASEIQNDIMSKWGGKHSYTDSKGNVYNVKFSANVTVVPFVNPYTAGATDNFIEITDIERSYVSGGNKGVWSTNPKGGAGTYAHEYGHLIGLTDGYIDTWLQTNIQGEYVLSSNVGENYASNDIMANHNGVVTQGNVNAVADYITQNIRKTKGPLSTTGQLKFGNSPLGPGLTAKDLQNANPPPVPDANSGDKTLQYDNGGGSSQPEAATRGEARSEYKFDGE